MASAVRLLFEVAGNYVKELTGMNQAFELMSKGINAVSFATDALTGGFGSLYSAAKFLVTLPFQPLIVAFDLLSASVGAVYDGVVALFGYLWDAIKSAAGFAWDTITSLAGYMYDAFKSSIDFLWTSITELGAYAITVTKDFALDFVDSLYDTGVMFDTLKIRMEAVFGSGAIAQQALDWGTKFGASTPLQLEEVANAMTKLKIYGFDPMDGTLRTLGDASYALGTDLEGIIDALGKMALKGKVSARELMQLTVRSIPAYDILKEKFNLTADEVANIGNAGLDADEAIQAIIDSLGTKYTGAMEKASNKTKGAVSTILDIWTVFQKTVADAGMWDAVTKGVVGFRDFLSTSLGGAFGETLASSISRALGGAARAINQGDYLAKAVLGIGKTFKDAFGVIERSIPQLARIFDTVFNESLKGYQFFIKNVVDIYKTILPEVGKIIKFLPAITKAFRELSGYVGKLFKKYLPSVVNFSINAISKLVGYVQDGVTAFNKWEKSTAGLKVKKEVTDTYEKVLKYVSSIFNKMKETVKNVDYGKLWENIKFYAATAYVWMLKAYDVVVDIYIAAGLTGNKLYKIAETLFNIVGDIGGYVVEIIKYVKVVAPKAVDAIIDALPRVENFLRNLFKAIFNFYELVFIYSKNLFKLILDSIPFVWDVLKGVGNLLKDIFVYAVDNINNVFEAIVNITNIVDSLFIGALRGGKVLFQTLALLFNNFFSDLVKLSAQAGKISSSLDVFKNFKVDISTPDIDSKIKKLEDGIVARNIGVKVIPKIELDMVIPDYEPTKKAFGNMVDGMNGMIDALSDDFNKIFDSTKAVTEIKKVAETAEEWAERIGNMKYDDDPNTKNLTNKDVIRVELPEIPDIGVKFRDGEMDKLQGEVVVKLQQDETAISKISENEMLVALAKLLQDALVSSAAGEPIPLVYS